MAYLIPRHIEPLRGQGRELVFWVLIVALVDMLPIPAWRDLQMDMSFPLLMAVAILYDPTIALLVAFVGSFDPREIRREIDIWRALFNRSQIALAVFLASLVFHALGTAHSSWPLLIPAAVLAAITDYAINSTTVTLGGSLLYELPFMAVARRLRIGNPAEFLLSYVGLGVLGALLARLYVEVNRNEWVIALFLMPALLARQMFFRSRALEEATIELKEREKVLQRLSNLMAEERHDERQQVANYLHDDLAQVLFQAGLQIDLARKQLSQGSTKDTEQQLAEIRRVNNRAYDLVRALVRDLHTSSLGRQGLTEALSAFTSDMSMGTDIHVAVEGTDLEMPPPIQLLLYQIAREAVTNAVKHAHPENIWVRVGATEDHVELTVRDDGEGFDPETPQPEGHYGLAIMRERAQVAGGSIQIESAPGSGTVATVRFPKAWLGSGEEPAPEEQSDDSPDDARPEPERRATPSA